jgi:hypothetical protein
MSPTGRSTTQRPHRHLVETASVVRLSAALIVAALLLAACGTSTPTGSPTATVSAPSATAAPSAAPTGSPAAVASATAEAPSIEPTQKTVKVSLVTCPTTFGVPGDSLPPVPATMTATLSTDVANLASFYGNGTLTLLGPKGWQCSAAVGADGSTSMSITPPGQAQPSGSPPPDYQAVTAWTGGACIGCIAQTACAVFPEAWKLFATPGQACPNTIPAAEIITRPMAQSAVFDDPPGTAGTGYPSGGTYRARGYLVFDPGRETGGSTVRLPSSLKVTCTLPDALAPICDETVEGARQPPTP